ncbi:DUF2798 domain-containing protein [Chryseolinea lacunae]|uniref:DUF2798 domain-containing protein n=1 Tax=Chryseolinea lacunae TaxID=2801331 RepID=A0ABS1KZA3_9BACT|nr:DUF2798 domain-containing protein [Chryseolinea lacunae]MBL0744791.1 DUF2798 domain-containing protein [Chryseolinea lacunae]
MHIRFRRFINVALIIGPMTLIMAFVGVIRNHGFQSGWVVKSVMTWFVMFPIAYTCALFIIPVANRLTGRIKFRE